MCCTTKWTSTCTMIASGISDAWRTPEQVAGGCTGTPTSKRSRCRCDAAGAGRSWRKPCARPPPPERLSRDCAVHELPSVEFFGDAIVVLEERLAVDIGKFDRAHVGERLLHALSPQSDVFDSGNDAAEQPAPEQAHRFRRHRSFDGLLHREAEVFPQLLLIEAVAHVVTRFDGELLALAALGLGELGVQIAQRQAPEGD